MLVELGPTPRADLSPVESRNIFFPAKGNKFEGWSTHAHQVKKKEMEAKERAENTVVTMKEKVSMGEKKRARVNTNRTLFRSPSTQ